MIHLKSTFRRGKAYGKRFILLKTPGDHSHIKVTWLRLLAYQIKGLSVTIPCKKGVIAERNCTKPVERAYHIESEGAQVLQLSGMEIYVKKILFLG